MNFRVILQRFWGFEWEICVETNFFLLKLTRASLVCQIKASHKQKDKFSVKVIERFHNFVSLKLIDEIRPKCGI